jgi:[NiFe] hydrogenase diaphorase moiety large subunit
MLENLVPKRKALVLKVIAFQMHEAVISEIIAEIGKDRTRLLDILTAAQTRFGHLSNRTLTAIAATLDIPYVEVADTATFYAFFTREPGISRTVRLSKTPISFMKGAQEVARAFEQTIGASMGTTGADGIALRWTSDVGMADQEPACLIDANVFTNLTPEDAAPIVREMRSSDFKGVFSSPKVGCASRVLKKGAVFFAPMDPGSGLRNALATTPEEVIEEVTRSGLRGRGGAGFPTGTKWRFTRRAQSDTRYIICNADEGEPGTFKDRVLLAELPDLVFEGMTIAGYALGAKHGVMYLRAEYAYLFKDLQRVLAERRSAGLLGERIGGRADFSFDIRIALGAGAYICGEESALIESLEGKRGAPRDRPPYPTERGYLGKPTAVNNVETLACVPRIMECGAAWFSRFGTAQSKGTKLMCVAGDCERPGVYETELGITLNELLDLAGAGKPQAVQVSGPAGRCVAPKDFGRRLCYEDLSTDGATMVFGPQRDILAVVHQFADFFEEESCGWCVPCRVGTVLLKESVEKVMSGRASREDLAAMERLAGSVSKMSRCGLGQTAPNPILNTLRDFPHLYEAKLRENDDLRFDLQAALRGSV